LATVVALIAAPEAMAATAIAEPATAMVRVENLRLGILLEAKMTFRPGTWRAWRSPMTLARRQRERRPASACACVSGQGNGRFDHFCAHWALNNPPCHGSDRKVPESRNKALRLRHPIYPICPLPAGLPA
jgi:hypothetical protein